MINNIWQQSYQTKLRLSYTEWKEISFYIQEWKQFELKLITSNYIEGQTTLFFLTQAWKPREVTTQQKCKGK